MAFDTDWHNGRSAIIAQCLTVSVQLMSVKMSDDVAFLVAAQFALIHRGWSACDVAPKPGAPLLWTVYADRGEHHIVARSIVRWLAWDRAARLAGKLDQPNASD